MKIEWCVERGNSEKNSEFQMGFEPTTFRTPVGYSNHWATRTLVVNDGQLWVDTTTASRKSHCANEHLDLEIKSYPKLSIN